MLEGKEIIQFGEALLAEVADEQSKGAAKENPETKPEPEQKEEAAEGFQSYSSGEEDEASSNGDSSC